MQALRATHMAGALGCTCSSAPKERAPAPSRPVARALPRGLGAAAAGSTALTALGAATARAAAAFEPSASSLPSLPSVDLPAVSLPDVDLSSIDLSGGDPLLVGGAVLALAVPAAVLALAGGGNSGPKAKAVPAARALEALAADESCILLDIRSKAEVKEEGAPNLTGLSRRGAVSLPYVIAIKVTSSRVHWECRDGVETGNAGGSGAWVVACGRQQGGAAGWVCIAAWRAVLRRASGAAACSTGGIGTVTMWRTGHSPFARIALSLPLWPSFHCPPNTMLPR